MSEIKTHLFRDVGGRISTLVGQNESVLIIFFLYVVSNKLCEVHLFECYWVPHLDIISPKLIEFIDSYASIRVCRAFIRKIVNAMRSHH